MICAAVTYVIKPGHEEEAAELFRTLTHNISFWNRRSPKSSSTSISRGISGLSIPARSQRSRETELVPGRFSFSVPMP